MDILGVFAIPNWLLIAVMLFVTYVVYMSWNHGIFTSLGIKGPKPLPVVGNLFDSMKMGIHGADKYYCQKYGKVFGVFEARNPVLVVADDEMLKQIMVKDFNNFPNRRYMPDDMVGYPMNKALIFTNDDHWRFIRNFITPTFSAGKLKKMVGLVNKLCDNLLDILESKAKQGDDVEIKMHIEHFTMDFISGTAFGMDVNSLQNPNDPFVENARQVLNFITMGSPYIVIVMFFPFLLPLLSLMGLHLFSKKNMKFFVDVTNQIIAERKKQKNGSRYVDFIQLMINAEEEQHSTQNDDKTNKENVHPTGLTNDEINAQALLFFLAGYDTTASTMSLFMYNIATHPDAQEKLLAEIDEYLADEQPNYENIHHLEYLDMCLNETLRIYPPGIRADRVASKDCVINEVKIPKGITVAIPIYAIHHDPDRWENPEEFDPERFSAKNKSKHGPYDFLPFGHGPRNCIGMRLALMEAKMTLVRIFQKFRFFPCDKTQIPLTFDSAGLLRPSHGVWLKIESRK